MVGEGSFAHLPAFAMGLSQQDGGVRASVNEDCARMDRTTFADQAVIGTMAGTIPARMDALFHMTWARRLGFFGPPAFVIYGSDGKVVDVRRGGINDAQFRAFVVSGKLNR